MTVKVTVNLLDSEIKFLQDTTKNEGLTFTDILMRAINTEKFFCDQETAGNKLIVEDNCGTLRELLRR